MQQFSQLQQLDFCFFTSQPECIDYNLKYMRSVLDQTGRYGFELKKNQLAI